MYGVSLEKCPEKELLTHPDFYMPLRLFILSHLHVKKSIKNTPILLANL